MNPLIETWYISNRINLYLLEAIAEENLKDVSSSKGRNVGEQFAHIHNVRLMWLQQGYPEAATEINKIEKENITKTILQESLSRSAEAIAKLIEKGIEDGKIKGFKPHPTAFLGYIISHESHHRGQLILALKQSGHPIDKKIAFGLWEWGTR
jgi:uncharacterized damage-inducible protein DinB